MTAQRARRNNGLLAHTLYYPKLYLLLAKLSIPDRSRTTNLQRMLRSVWRIIANDYRTRFGKVEFPLHKIYWRVYCSLPNWLILRIQLLAILQLLITNRLIAIEFYQRFIVTQYVRRYLFSAKMNQKTKRYIEM